MREGSHLNPSAAGRGESAQREVGSPCLQRKAVPFLSEPRFAVRASVACAARPGALFLLVSEGHVGASISAKVLTDGWEHPHFSRARSILLPSLGDPPHGLETGTEYLGWRILCLCVSVHLSVSLCPCFFLSVCPSPSLHVSPSLSLSSVSLCLFFLVAEQLSPGPLNLRRQGIVGPSAAPGSGPYSFPGLINSECRGPGNPAEPRGWRDGQEGPGQT